MTIEEQYRERNGVNLLWRMLCARQGWKVVGGPFWCPEAHLPNRRAWDPCR